jgi:hypothetical protein
MESIKLIDKALNEDTGCYFLTATNEAIIEAIKMQPDSEQVLIRLSKDCLNYEFELDNPSGAYSRAQVQKMLASARWMLIRYLTEKMNLVYSPFDNYHNFELVGKN